MKAVMAHEFGGAEALSYEDSIKPRLHKGELLIKVRASSINPIDTKSIRADSEYKDLLTLPLIPGVDVAGIVADIGEGVTSLKTGEKVYGYAGVLQQGTGAFAEYTVVPENSIAKMPENLTFTEAGAISLAASSAYLALVGHMKLQPAQKILIHGGAGGIGTFAIQLAKHLGAHVTATTSVDGIVYATFQGADEVIDYEFQSFEKILKDYDAVLDTVGGEVYTKSFQVLKKGGIIVSMLCPPNETLMKQYTVRAVLEVIKVNQDLLNKISTLVEEGVLKVNISKIYPLKNIRDAFEAKENDHVLGKIAIEVA